VRRPWGSPASARVNKRLEGIQAVQTLSRLNRAHSGKDTTYVLDFVNSADEVLAAFKTYYETAELADTTDPNLVLNLRNKLDAAGHYDPILFTPVRIGSWE
jgi:type I restriction enzyme R subunit